MTALTVTVTRCTECERPAARSRPLAVLEGVPGVVACPACLDIIRRRDLAAAELKMALHRLERNAEISTLVLLDARRLVDRAVTTLSALLYSLEVAPVDEDDR